MLRLTIGKMRLQSAKFVLLLLCIFLVCGEARPGIFDRSDRSRAEMIEGLSLLQRKILQDQQLPISTESRTDEVQETVKQVEQKKQEPQAEEKNEWIRETKEDEVAVREAEEKKEWIRETKEDDVAVRQEPKADRVQTKVEENNEAWHQETKEGMAQIKMEVNEKATYQGRKAEEADTTSEEEEHKMAAKIEAKTDEKSENQWTSDNVEENPVARKVEEWKEPKVEEKKGELQKQISVEEKKEEPKIEQSEDSPVDRPNENLKDQLEERKQSMVADRKQISVDEKKQKPTVEERRKDPQVDRRIEDMKEHPEERKESMVEDQTRISLDEKKENPKVEERRKGPQLDRTIEGIKDTPDVNERKESMLDDRKKRSVDSQVEPKEGMNEVTKVEEKNVHSPNPDDRKQKKAVQTNLGENDERKVEDRKWERQGEEEALKLQDKKEDKAQVGLKYDDEKDKEGKSATPSKIDKDKPIQSGHQEVPHPDLDDDYPDFLDELRNFPERFQKTAKSVKDHIRYSGLDRYSTHSKELFNHANQQIEQSFTPLLGKDYAPLLAYFVSYGLLLLPLALVTYLLDRIRARYSLQKILLFVDIYLSAYFATLLVVALVLHSEPMSFFMKYSSSSYIFLQLLQGFGFVMYLLLTTAELISTCSNGRIAAKLSSLLQWLVVVAVGFHYYVTVFHRAMARKAPLTGWKIYGLYSIAFIFLCLFARIERGKKHYISVEVDDITDKKN